MAKTKPTQLHRSLALASAKTITLSCPSSPPVFSPLEAAQMEHDDWLTGPYTDDWLDVPDIPSTWDLEDDE